MQEKTARGVYLDVENSPIIYRHNDKIYHFSSEKKKDMFLKRVLVHKGRVDRIKSMILSYGADLDMPFKDMYDMAYDKAYDSMICK